MKPVFFSLLALSLLATSSCKDDDSTPAPQAPAENTLVFDGTPYQANTGVMDDYGPVSITGTEDSHYNALLTVTNASTANSAIGYMLMADLYSAGAADFKTGTFSWFDQTQYEDADVANKSVFIGALILDGNKDGDVEDIASGDDVHLEPTGGKITISGTRPAYTLTYDLSFEGGKKLTGHFSGSFHEYDESDEGWEANPEARILNPR